MIKIGNYEFESIDVLAETLKLSNDETKRLLDLYNETKDSKYVGNLKKDETGKVILPKGTVIHGLVGEKFNESVLKSISEQGLLSGAIMSKNAVNDLGVNGWMITEEQSMQQFYDSYNTLKDKGGFLRVTDVTTGKQGGLGRIATFMPIEPQYKPINKEIRTAKLAFIIQPTEKTSIVNEKCGNGHIGNGTYASARTIPIGVPVNAISGILLSKGASPKVINKLIELFPEQYITTPEGELVYEPYKNKEFKIGSDPKADAKDIAATELARNVQNESVEIREGYEDITKPKDVEKIID